MKQEIKSGKPQCPNCSSKNIMFAKKTKTLWCRVCGQEWSKGGKINEA